MVAFGAVVAAVTVKLVWTEPGIETGRLVAVVGLTMVALTGVVTATTVSGTVTTFPRWPWSSTAVTVTLRAPDAWNRWEIEQDPPDAGADSVPVLSPKVQLKLATLRAESESTAEAVKAYFPYWFSAPAGVTPPKEVTRPPAPVDPVPPLPPLVPLILEEPPPPQPATGVFSVVGP